MQFSCIANAAGFALLCYTIVSDKLLCYTIVSDKPSIFPRACRCTCWPATILVPLPRPCSKWSVKPQPYGEAWVQGDVMGCALDLDAGSLTFYRNGVSMGVAYDRVRTMQPSLAYFPAVSLSHTERCCLNFGGKPFVYPLEGYQPLHAPPGPAEQAAAAYYCSCLGRLVRLAGERHSSNTSSSGGGSCSSSLAAAGAAVPVVVGHLPASSSKLQDEMQQGIAAVAAAPASPPAAVAAAAAAERLGLGCPNSCSPRQSASNNWCPPYAAAATASTAAAAALSDADVVLLAAVLLEPLEQQLVLQPYLVHSALLPLLLDLQQEGEAAGQQRPLQLLLQLALAVWQQEGFSRIMMTLLEDLAYRWVGCGGKWDSTGARTSSMLCSCRVCS
jgi:hypothetical protein